MNRKSMTTRMAEAREDIRMEMLIELFRKFAAMDPDSTVKTGELAMLFFDALPPEAQQAVKDEVQKAVKEDECVSVN